MTTTYTEQAWLQTPPGRYLLGEEQRLYDQAVVDLFGFNAVQLGLPQADLLRECRIPFRCKAAPYGQAAVQCHSFQLPFANNSIDLLLLPHVLEYSLSPHDTLREAERVLVPEGHLILSGFNPFSLWGLRRLFARRTSYPWCGHFMPLPKLKDWLVLLGLEVVGGRMSGYAPPFGSEAWINRCRFMDRAGDRWWPLLGGSYFLLARKRVVGVRLIRPNWNSARMVRALVPKPTQEAECQKTEHGQQSRNLR